MANNNYLKELLELQRKQYQAYLLNNFLTGGGFIIALIAFVIALLK
jgi:hypothetical protein